MIPPVAVVEFLLRIVAAPPIRIHEIIPDRCEPLGLGKLSANTQHPRCASLGWGSAKTRAGPCNHNDFFHDFLLAAPSSIKARSTLSESGLPPACPEKLQRS